MSIENIILYYPSESAGEMELWLAANESLLEEFNSILDEREYLPGAHLPEAIKLVADSWIVLQKASGDVAGLEGRLEVLEEELEFCTELFENRREALVEMISK